MARLRDVLTISASKLENNDDKKWLLNLDAVEQQTGSILSYNYVSKDELNGSIIAFDSENVLYSKLRPNLNKVVLPYRSGYATSEMLPLRPNTTVLTREYLAAYLRSDNFVNWATTKAIGAKMPRLSSNELLNKEILLPPISEQRRITSILDKLNNLISLRKQHLSKLDELVKVRFVEMFGDPVLNPMNWPIHELQKYIKFLTSGSRGWTQYFTKAGEYFITIKNVKNCCITLNDVQYVVPPNNSEAKRTKVEEGDLLISITADLGRTGVVTKEIADYGAYINQHLTCIRLDRSALHPLYVAYYMESEAGKAQFQAKNQVGVKAGLNFNAINSLRLMVPPLEVQNGFVKFVERVNSQKLTIQQSLDKLEVLKKSLMQKYFG